MTKSTLKDDILTAVVVIWTIIAIVNIDNEKHLQKQIDLLKLEIQILKSNEVARMMK